MTIREMLIEVRRLLTPEVGEDEARAMSEMILEEVKGYDKVQLFLNDHRELTDDTVTKIHSIVADIVAGAPIQYVLGSTIWRGRRFKVSENVLIPRPETAELVDLIIDNHHGEKDLKILDVGTGSGCIAISLSLDLPFSQVDAVDISTRAIIKAKSNAATLNARVRFSPADAFTLDDCAHIGPKYDIIVSNPPYVLESERESIDNRVKLFEPEIALFVADERPIEIYKAIATYAYYHLSQGGALYFEINPLCVDLLKKMLNAKGFVDIMAHRDYKGNYRFISCRR